MSGSGDQGADPNQLVAITDRPASTAPDANEQFQTVVAPTYAQVVRGVSLTPRSSAPPIGWPFTRRIRRHG